MIVGIDPGLSGALAFYRPLEDLFEVEDVPTFTVPVNKKMRRVLDLNLLSALIQEKDTFFGIDMVVLEDVHSMPKQGVASSFTFGRVFGSIEGILAALEIPITRIPPHAWKRRFKCAHDKDATRRRASELMPNCAHWWPLKKHDGRAEAALLALYGAKHL